MEDHVKQYSYPNWSENMEDYFQLLFLIDQLESNNFYQEVVLLLLEILENFMLLSWY